MPQISLSEEQSKELLKQAIIELLQERKDLFSDVIAEALEDIALVNAIKKGEATETVSREEIFRTVP